MDIPSALAELRAVIDAAEPSEPPVIGIHSITLCPGGSAPESIVEGRAAEGPDVLRIRFDRRSLNGDLLERTREVPLNDALLRAIVDDVKAGLQAVAS